jgi:hypothetical protein
VEGEGLRGNKRDGGVIKRGLGAPKGAMMLLGDSNKRRGAHRGERGVRRVDVSI